MASEFILEQQCILSGFKPIFSVKIQRSPRDFNVNSVCTLITCISDRDLYVYSSNNQYQIF